MQTKLWVLRYCLLESDNNPLGRIEWRVSYDFLVRLQNESSHNIFHMKSSSFACTKMNLGGTSLHVFFMWMASEDSFWYWGTRQLGNGPFSAVGIADQFLDFWFFFLITLKRYECSIRKHVNWIRIRVHSGSLNNWGESAAFVMTSANG